MYYGVYKRTINPRNSFTPLLQSPLRAAQLLSSASTSSTFTDSTTTLTPLFFLHCLFRRPPSSRPSNLSTAPSPVAAVTGTASPLCLSSFWFLPLPEKKDGKKRKISDLVRQFWTKEDGTWTGSTPASYVEKFETLVMKENENNSEEIMTSIEEKKLWITACGGPKNKRIFALGEEGTALLRSGTISTSQPHDTEAFNEAFAQPFKDDIQELRATVVDLLKQQQEQQQKQAEFQTLILQHLIRLQANQN